MKASSKAVQRRGVVSGEQVPDPGLSGFILGFRFYKATVVEYHEMFANIEIQISGNVGKYFKKFGP